MKKTKKLKISRVSHITISQFMLTHEINKYCVLNKRSWVNWMRYKLAVSEKESDKISQPIIGSSLMKNVNQIVALNQNGQIRQMKLKNENTSVAQKISN